MASKIEGKGKNKRGEYAVIVLEQNATPVAIDFFKGLTTSTLIPALAKKVDEIGTKSKKVVFIDGYSQVYKAMNGEDGWLKTQFKINGISDDVGFLSLEDGAEFYGKAAIKLLTE